MNIYPIPYDFIDKITKLSWYDIRWGYKYKFITSEVPIRNAEEKVLAGSYTESELELLFITCDKLYDESNCMIYILDKICSETEEKNKTENKEKWLFIVLSWLWSNRNNFKDPLFEVESIYADFDYPAEIEDFISYMPHSGEYDPSAHTHEENINRLMGKWENYLKRKSLIFKN